jgi:hypothetical protein
MADFDQLNPGSPAAKAKGCTCRASDGAHLAADRHCPLHGLDALARALDDPKNAGVIEDARRARRRQLGGED